MIKMIDIFTLLIVLINLFILLGFKHVREDRSLNVLTVSLNMISIVLNVVIITLTICNGSSTLLTIGTNNTIILNVFKAVLLFNIFTILRTLRWLCKLV